MVFFQCDYAEGCHPRILEKLTESNLLQSVGYGLDEHCENARSLIKKACGREDIDVHFLVGGTQTNITVISASLRPHQGVLSSETGHIACHETGAIEATGHKVLTLPSQDGKITAEQIETAWRDHWASSVHEHLVQPGMVYISFPTENGTLYSKEELTKISEACRRCKLPLFIDGARLGYGLTSPENDLTLPEIARLADVFYIGGTKCGAMIGEAVVICHPDIARDFRYVIKRHGGMLAKGRILGIQFEELFKDGLYFDICREANNLAYRIRDAFIRKGIPLFGASPTNQQFVQLTDEQIAWMDQRFLSEVWCAGEAGRTVIRFCTSWATTEKNVAALEKAIEEMP